MDDAAKTEVLTRVPCEKCEGRGCAECKDGKVDRWVTLPEFVETVMTIGYADAVGDQFSGR